MKKYKTAEVAAIVGIHPNTVRLYEEWGMITKPERQENGYRIFTDLHIMQIKLARTAFQIEILQNGLRKKIVEMVKTTATGDYDRAILLTEEYLKQLQQERYNAEEAIQVVHDILSGSDETNKLCMKRKEVSEYLNYNPQKDRRKLFQKVGVQFQECDYQPEIKVSELCEETACLYKTPADWRELCNQFGIGNKIKNAVKSLSGGERQRLFIVLALIPNPEIVFLDELTTGLDAKARRDVWKILSDLKKKGLSIFLTSHFMDEVEVLCDEICILRKGKVVFYGTVEEAKVVTGSEKFEDAYLILSGEEVDEE